MVYHIRNRQSVVLAESSLQRESIMDLTLFGKLKEKLKTATKFDEIWNYFFDHFMENAEFMAMGKPIQRHELLEAVLAQIAARLFKTDKAILAMRLIKLDEQNFIHGCGMLNGQLTSVIYFEDDHVGVFNIVMGDGRTEIARFSGQPFMKRRNYNPSLN
jgi:hypothetical protein